MVLLLFLPGTSWRIYIFSRKWWADFLENIYILQEVPVEYGIYSTSGAFDLEGSWTTNNSSIILFLITMFVLSLLLSTKI